MIFYFQTSKVIFGAEYTKSLRFITRQKKRTCLLLKSGFLRFAALYVIISSVIVAVLLLDDRTKK